MKRIIKGKKCNTETAKLLGEREKHNDPTAGDWYCDKLYLTKSGAYFLYGYGNWQSKYSKRFGEGRISGGDEWELFPNASAARQWAEENLTADDYIAAFGEPGDDETEFIAVRISAEARAKLDAERDRTGETLGAIVDRAIMGL